MQKNDKVFRHRVLVIDPDQEFCKNVGMYLEDSFNVYIRDSLEYLDYTIILNQIQLILVNVDNANEDLLENLFSLKQHHPEVKILLMYTMVPENPSIRLNLKQIADATITKPFDVELLKTKMDCLLKEFYSKEQHDFS